MRKETLLLPFSGAEWIGDPTYEDVTLITMVNGETFVVPKTMLFSEGLMQFTTVDGDSVCINTSHILYVRQYRMWTARARNIGNTLMAKNEEYEYRGLIGCEKDLILEDVSAEDLL